MTIHLKNNYDWFKGVEKPLVPSLFLNTLNCIKPVKIFILIFFMLWVGFTFFSIIQLGPRRGGVLVPISILNYEDLSISQPGSLRICLNTFQDNFSLSLFPSISKSLQTEKDILEFLIKKNKACIKENIVFRIDGRALPAGEGDIILLPSNYGSSSTVNGIELSEILFLIMEFPCKNRLVFLDVMSPWNNISHGGLLWDLGRDINNTLELAKAKYKHKYGFSADSISFHLFSASGDGHFSNQIGVSDTLFYDQIYNSMAKITHKKLSSFDGLLSINNLAKDVINEIDKNSLRIFEKKQKPFLVGWGKDFPISPKKDILLIDDRDTVTPFIWPEQYFKAWAFFNQLKVKDGYGKYPKAMSGILTLLLDFQSAWINSNSNDNVLKTFNNDFKYYFDLVSNIDKSKQGFVNLVSIENISDHFTLVQLNQFRLLFSTTFGNLRSEKNDVLLASLNSKEFLGAIEKLTPLELEFLLLDSIIESSNYNYLSLISISDFIYKHHKDFLAFETFGFQRFLTSALNNPEFKNVDFCKVCLRARIECNKLLFSVFKNKLMFKGMQKSMSFLDKGDWLLEHGNGNQMKNIISLYEEAEKLARITFLASKSLEKATTLLDRSLIELFLSVSSSSPGTVVLSPILEKLEKLGRYILKCELEMEDFSISPSFVIDDQNITGKISEFIYETDLIVAPFEQELNNLKDSINGQIIPALIKEDKSLPSDQKYISEKLPAQLFVFSDDKNIKNLLEYLAFKNNMLKEFFNLPFSNSGVLNSDDKSNKFLDSNLPLLRYNLVLVHISLMRSIGLEVLADKLSSSLNKIDSSIARSKNWIDLIKLLPKLFINELYLLDSAQKFYVRDRLSFISRRPIYFSDNNLQYTKTKQRSIDNLIMVQNVINNRFSLGLDGDFCAKILQEIESYSLPTIPINRFLSQGDMSVLIFNNNYNLQREFSFRGSVFSKIPPNIEFVEKSFSKYDAFFSDLIIENVPGSQIFKITGKVNVSLLKKEKFVVPMSTSLQIKISYDSQSDYYDIPLLFNPNTPELEIIFRNNNGDLLEDNFKSRTLLEGEKLTIFVRNNSLKPKEAYIKISSGVNKGFLADCKVSCPDNVEVPVVFKSNIVTLKPDSGFSIEFPSYEKIIFEISDNLKPSKVYQLRLFSPSIIDPTDYLFVEDAKYYPSNLLLNKNPSVRFSLRSQNNNLSPQPFVGLRINQVRAPSFKSGTGSTSLFLKADNSVELFLKDLNLDANLPVSGEVYLDVDYFKRCFRYGFDISPHGSPFSLILNNNNEIRFSGQFEFNDNNMLLFQVEGDGGTVNSTLEVGLWDDLNTDKFPIDFTLSELSTKILSVRNKKFKLLQKPGDYNFHLYSSVDDWKVQWDVSGLSGKKVIHAVMRNEKGDIISRTSKNLVIDFSPPKIQDFVVLTDLVVPGKFVRLAFNASDQESGLSKINLYFIKTGGEKPVLLEIPLNKSIDFPDQFVGSFLVPLELKSAFDISIIAVNGSGKSFTLTKTIRFANSLTSPVVTCIKGVVKEGGRLQPGMVVSLYDAKSKKKRVVVTNDNGEFVFEKLEPLNYKVSVEKPSSFRSAVKFIDLNIGQSVNLVLELLQ